MKMHDFMSAAKQADFVFTTGIDVIPEYQRVLGHNRVYHLHFAAQPKYHNPLEKFTREDKFCFAGTYYHTHKERSAFFDEIAYYLIDKKGLDIYARNYKHEPYADMVFPERYNRFILGELRPDEIEKAYKAYYCNINLNTISQSKSMFSRRVFELMASNTIVVGNYSRGLKNYFGDLTISVTGVGEMRDKLRQYCPDEASIKKYRLPGLRKVLTGHLYEDRLAYIVKKVFGRDLLPAMPSITVFAKTKSGKESNYVLSCFERQSYPHKQLVLNPEGTCCVSGYAGYAGVFHPDDYYCGNYLTDLALSARWADCGGIGKSLYYAKTDEGIALRGAFGYQTVSVLSPRRAIFKSEWLSNKTIDQLLSAETIVSSNEFVSVDELNYCENTNDPNEIFADLLILNQGEAEENQE
ncbi:MAG: glycosyltransferase [Oscillospiraceae bacterium]|nr:glycosyltransferase [Oscillospiraceae bacterium]